MPEPTPTAPVVTTPPAPATPPVTGATPPVEEPLGTPGLAALQRERERVAELERTLAQVNARVAEFEQRDLSEVERLKAEAERLAGELGTERATRLRLEIASEHEITGDDLVLLTATDEATLRAQAARIQAKNTAAATAAGSAPLPGQGTPAVAQSTASVAAGKALYEQQKQKT
jgi:hypothetical protein